MVVPKIELAAGEHSRTIPKGFHTFSTNCGIKDSSLDLGVVFSEKVCQSAAFFTRSQIQGEPIKIDKEHYQKNQFQAVVVNSKNANVFYRRPRASKLS